MSSRQNVQDLRETLVEAAAEANEELMDKYLESGELTIDEIKAGYPHQNTGE